MASQTTRLHNLPLQVTPFIGRASDVGGIVERLRLDSCRLLTLVGVGGIGKTRLALEVINTLTTEDFPHGVFYVPLAPLTSSDSIVTTIIATLGITVGQDGSLQDELIRFLSQRELLLVLDNFEHLMDGADFVADMLRSTQDVKILVTSREVLNLSIEHIWHVSTMPYPQETDPDDINQYDALNLFIERATQVCHDFAPGDEQINIIRICQLVDGLPLGIELATSWLKIISTGDIIRQLEGSIDILETRLQDIASRHRSIRHVFDHSWQLLTADEQAVFPRLSVFRGGFTLEAAEQVAGASLGILAGLIDKSMIRHDKDGRYDIHELLRQYGEEQLIQADEQHRVQIDHLQYYTHFIASRVPDLQGKRQAGALDEFRADFDNIMVAWDALKTYNRFDQLAVMLEGVQIFFAITRHPPVATMMYTSMLNDLETQDDTEANLLRLRLQVVHWYSQFSGRKMLYEDQLHDEMKQTLQKIIDEGDSLLTLFCHLMLNFSNFDKTKRPDIETLTAISKQVHPFYCGWMLGELNYYLTIVRNDNSAETEQTLNDHLALVLSLNDTFGIAYAYDNLGHYMRFWGDIDKAITYFQLAMDKQKEIRNLTGVLVSKTLIVLIKLKKGDFEDVVHLLPGYIEQFNKLGFTVNNRFLYMIIAKAEILLGNYAQVQHSINKLANLIGDKRIRTDFHICELHIMYAIVLDDYHAVRKHIKQALTMDITVISKRLKLDFLPLVAFLFNHDEHYVEAVELLALALTHPLATTAWMNKWGLLVDLHDTLKAVLDEDAYRTAWARGSMNTVDATLISIRRYLNLDMKTTVSTNTLVEPLTAREQEVLVMLGKAYTNQQIADELIVALGTVKSHVYHICQKLGVKNRLQAVNEARRLRLL